MERIKREVKANLQILILFRAAGRYELVNDSSGSQQRSQRGLKKTGKRLTSPAIEISGKETYVVLPAGSAHPAGKNLG